jgi:hypothetical protein
MSGGLIGPKAAAAQIWIVPETFELVQVILTVPSQEAEEPSVWQVNFAQYDQVVNIEPPT